MNSKEFMHGLKKSKHLLKSVCIRNTANDKHFIYSTDFHSHLI